MNNNLKTLILSLSVILLSSLSLSFAANGSETLNDVRILIDVSGSMKQNDPENRRIPALQLMINLLPRNSRAGVWLFAENTQVLVPFGVVNEEWKTRAQEVAASIHSRGLLTDIENALQVVSDDWIGQAGSNRRNLVLLTDGVIDVAKDFMRSADSRERIITDLLPFLQKSAIQVNTIALSDNADSELLQKLAYTTNGWSEKVDSAERLQRVFLKMFNKAVPQETVPISDNKFIIDSSIKEFSLLIFKRAGAAPSKLITPDKQEISQHQTPALGRWLNEENYDLVTIKQPQAGQWQIIAEVDPDNMVMIITDLKLMINEMKNQLGAGESLLIRSHLTEQGQLITRQGFLKLTTFTIEHIDATGEKNQWTLRPVPGETGYFQQKLASEMLLPGKHTLKLRVDGGTFSREIRRSIEVVEKPLKIVTTVNHAQQSVAIQLIPDEKIIDSTFLSIEAIINKPGTDPETVNVKQQNGVWRIEIDAPPAGGKVRVNFSAMAKSKTGQPLSLNLLPVTIDASLFQAQKTIAGKEKNFVKQMAMTENQPADAAAENEPADSEQASGNTVDWKMTSVVVVGINLLLIIAGFLIYRYQKKALAEMQSQLLARLA